MNLLLVGSPWPHGGTPSTCTYEGGRLEMILEEPELNNGKDIIMACDGLFCLALVDKSFVIWNPILRELRKISTIKRQKGSLIGFGYDPSFQDHKIVLIPPFSSKAQVLTLKSSVSKMIDLPLRKGRSWINSKKRGILVGENIFWLFYPCEYDIEVSEDILTFSVGSEKFNYCSSPGPRRGQRFRDLNVLRGSLCAVERDYHCDDKVVWRADHDKEDKGRIKSWNKILRLKLSDIERSTCWKVNEFRLATVLNQAGSLLLKVSTREGLVKLCEYDLEEGTVSKVEASFPIKYYGEMYEYIATLVPTRAS